MQRTISLAATSSSYSSTSALSIRPLMAKFQLQCRALENYPASSSSSAVLVDSVLRYVSQVKLKSGNARCFRLACVVPSHLRLASSLSYATQLSCSSSGSLGNSFRPFLVNNLFPRRYCSRVPNTGNKNNNISGVIDEKTGGNKSGVKKFNKKWKKHKVLASTGAEAGVSTIPVIEDGCSGIKVELSTAASPASNIKQDSTAKTKRSPKSKKTKNKSSSAAPTLEEVPVEESSKSVPKPKRSGSSNKKSSFAKKEATQKSIMEGPDNSAPSTSKSERQHLKSKKARNKSQIAQQMKNSIEHRGQNVLKPLYPPSGKSVIVVESITKAKIIQGYLGNMYEVLPSYGHIRDLAARSGSVRPDEDFSMVWEVPSTAWTHLKSIKVALNGAENLILASDPDREGEAIAWHIIEMLQQQDALNESMTVARVVFHEITESAIKNALQSPREIDGDLVHAYLARRSLDYLIGFNISPLLWRKLPGCQSAGRVQSAALALICDRESEIDEFKPHEYWTVGIKLQGKDNSTPFSAHLTCFNSKKINQLSISSEAEAQTIEQMIRSEGFLVKGVKRSTTRKNPPTPYITSTLQQDAANKLHFSTTYTMKLAQKLYEGVQLSDGKAAGLITYMRTDGLHIADEAAKYIQSLAAERYGENFTSGSPRKYFRKVKNAQEAHEAIRPTDIRRLPSMLAHLLDEDSLKLYTLIWTRTLACQMEPASIGQMQIDIGNASGSIIFRSSCSKVEFPGYQAVYEDAEAKAIKYKDDDKISERDETFGALCVLKDGNTLHIGEVELKQHHTQHPPRYSEGSLIKKLEELGIGRPSTYASILKVLQDRNYVTIKSRVLYPEFRGRMVSAFLTKHFSEVTDYSFTADMETELDNVSGGLTEWKGLLRDYWTRFSSYCKKTEKVHIHEVEKLLEKKFANFLFSSLPDPSRTCPSCMEGTLNFKVSKYGAGYFIGCDQHPRCKYIAKTLYGEDEEEDDTPKSTSVEEPKLLGLHPTSSEKVLLKCGPYGPYVQLGEDKTGYLPQRASASHIKDVNSITLEGALDLLRYPLKLGSHPKDGQPVFLKLARNGFTVRHRCTMASVPKNLEPGNVTLEKAMKLLSGKNVRQSGRPKKVQPKVEEDEEEVEELEEVAEAL